MLNSYSNLFELKKKVDKYTDLLYIKCRVDYYYRPVKFILSGNGLLALIT